MNKENYRPQIGEILIDFEEDHDEEKAIRAIFEEIDSVVDEHDKIIADAIINFIRIYKERGYETSTILNNISNHFILADIIKGREL